MDVRHLEWIKGTHRVPESVPWQTRLSLDTGRRVSSNRINRL